MNIIVVMFFGVIFGLVVVVAFVIGGFMGKCMEDEGYDKFFGVVVNIILVIIGMMILFSNILIVYFLASGGVLIVVFFLVGYLLGIFIGLFFMIVVGVWAKWKGYFVGEWS